MFLRSIIFSDLNEVRKNLIQWFDWHNQEHFHQNLDNPTPDEFIINIKQFIRLPVLDELTIAELNPTPTLRLYIL